MRLLFAGLQMEEKYLTYKLFTIPKHMKQTYGYILDGEPALSPAIYPPIPQRTIESSVFTFCERFKLRL